jgi:hypothetical protein
LVWVDLRIELEQVEPTVVRVEHVTEIAVLGHSSGQARACRIWTGSELLIWHRPAVISHDAACHETT